RKFALPVNSEHKATQFRLFSIASPHMRAFHITWISSFACFVSTFAAPPLIPVIRDDLNLTSTDIGNAGIASVSGAIFARVAMGVVSDLVGPRLTSAGVLLLTAPPVFCFSVINSPTGFLLSRFFVGFSLANVVASLFWMSSMFSDSGTANGFALGWANLGGGATQLIMPLVFEVIHHIGAVKFTAWRIAFFIPGLFQTLSAYAVYFLAQDLPDGNYSELHKSGDKQKDGFFKIVFHAFRNYRGWILALTYGYCFGVELTTDNIIANYLYDRFDLNLTSAGTVAASFGLANLFTRPGGGVLSDIIGKRFGMRGRIWALWIWQTLGGVFCILLGKANSLGESIAFLVVFSIFVQTSCGLTYGIVPFISLRSLGIINGITAGGGNFGAVLTQVIFFRGTKYTTETGITLMGIMILCVTLLIATVYFPPWG
ncbi:hypothetical protein M569_15715, partial [Genlisea aurea]